MRCGGGGNNGGGGARRKKTVFQLNKDAPGVRPPCREIITEGEIKLLMYYRLVVEVALPHWHLSTIVRGKVKLRAAGLPLQGRRDMTLNNRLLYAKEPGRRPAPAVRKKPPGSR